MATLPTSAQVQSATVTNADQKTYFGNMLDFLLALLGNDSADKTAARAALQVPPEAARADVASVAGTVNLTTGAASTDDIRITGALAITAFTVRVGRVLRVVAGGAFSLANNANIVTNTGATLQLIAGDSFQLRATAANVVEVLGLSRAPAGQITASLGANVNLTNTANYFDGPSIAQGSTGTWFVSGSVVVGDTNAGGGNMSVKLWDGTTVIASGYVPLGVAGATGNTHDTVSLSGYITSPAGNLRMSVKNQNNTANTAILFNITGNSKDSTISAFRLA